MASNLTIESLDFDAIRRGDKRATGDAVEFLWLTLNEEARQRRRAVKLASDRAEWQVIIDEPTVQQNNYDIGNASVIEFRGATSFDLTGLLAPSAGAARRVLIVVLGSGTVTVKYNSASSDDVNRLLTHSAADVAITTNKCMEFTYLNSRWREHKYA